MARIEAFELSRLDASSNGRKEKVAARKAMIAAMRTIVRTARGNELTPGTHNKLLMTRRRSDIGVLSAARGILRDAEAVKNELVVLGLPDTCINDLRSLVEIFESTMGGRRTGRDDMAKVEGREDAVIDTVSKALSKLDIVVPNVVRDDPGLIASWKRTREVVGGPAPKKRAAKSTVSAEVVPIAGDPSKKAS